MNRYDLEGEPCPGSLLGPQAHTVSRPSWGLGGDKALVCWGHAGQGAAAPASLTRRPWGAFFPDLRDPAVQDQAVWGSPRFPLPAPTLLFRKRNLFQ